MKEAHVGYMAAMAAVNMAGSPKLWAGVWEKMDFPKVIPCNQKGLIVGPAGSVNVGAIWAIGPQTKDVEA